MWINPEDAKAEFDKLANHPILEIDFHKLILEYNGDFPELCGFSLALIMEKMSPLLDDFENSGQTLDEFTHERLSAFPNIAKFLKAYYSQNN